MCGITGIYSTQNIVSPNLILAMTNAILHRGPDDGGIYYDGNVAIGNRRLSIIDLSAAGHQPMEAPECGMWIVYNGEIYNFKELRTELEQIGYHFLTKTDTEVVLKAYHAWREKSFSRLRGMFAFAIWDKNEQTLILARDAFGIKPLYIANCGTDIVFGSEIKSLRIHPNFPTQVNINALSFYLSHLYTPEPHSIYAGVEKLPAGTWLRIGPNGRKMERFYEPQSPQPNYHRTYARTVDELINVLQESVQAHLIADVPLGVFLSGGVDSSALVALMRRANQSDIKTFTIGFEGDFASYDERIYARRVANYFHTSHNEVVVKPSVVDLVESRLIPSFDEPFANPAALIADILSEFTRTQVTVALSGVGSDEFFAGYPRYQGMLLLDKFAQAPNWMKNALQSTLSIFPFSPDRRNRIERIRRFVNAAQTPFSNRYETLTRFTGEIPATKLLCEEFQQHVDVSGVLPETKATNSNLLEQLLQLDRQTYLPGDLLTYTDRTSMANSLEVRTPFCDISVDEFARTIPPEYKIRGGELKFILKDAFKTLLPSEVLSRPKRGFSVPIGEWLSGPLRPTLHELLSPSHLRQQPYIDYRQVKQILSRFEAGEHQNAFLLWGIFIFLLWDAQKGHLS